MVGVGDRVVLTRDGARMESRMQTCKSGVSTGLESPKFRECGKSTEVSMYVGKIRCHFCKEHAAQAIKFVMTTDIEALLKIQNIMKIHNQQ